MSRRRVRGVCLTVNNPDEEDWGAVTGLFYCYGAKYLIIGEEIGENGTYHLQAYAYFPNKIEWKTVKRQCPRAHIETQRGTCLEALLYCMKEGEYHEFGERPHQGKRSDIDVIKYDLLKGRPIKDISKEYFQLWCQYRRAFDEFKIMHMNRDKILYIYDSENWDECEYVFGLVPSLYLPDPMMVTKASIFRDLYIHKQIAVGYSPWMDDLIDDPNRRYQIVIVSELLKILTENEI